MPSLALAGQQEPRVSRPATHLEAGPLISLAGDEVHKSVKFLFSLAPKGERESEGEGLR
jgi:hypothetical protein